MSQGRERFYQCGLLAIAVATLAISVGCSSQRISPVAEPELQTVGTAVVPTQPLVDGVKIPRDFFDELYPDYSRGITVVLSIASHQKNLTIEDHQELAELIRQSKKTGQIHQVSLFAWGSNKKSLKHSAATNLEKVRAAIVQHLQSKPVLMSTYNMEDPPSWSSRLVMTKEARMKAYFRNVDKEHLHGKVIVAVSTMDENTYVHPEMVSL